MSNTICIYAAIPDSVRDSGPAKLTWELPTQPANMQDCYNTRLGYTTYELSVG